jgi:hypothetical protein
MDYGIDNEGFILTEVEYPKISPDYMKVVQDISVTILNVLQVVIHSMYLYGSIASGKAVAAGG